MPAPAEAPSLTTAQTRVKRWVGKSGEGVFKVTRLAVIALTVALIVLLFVTRNVPAYLAGLGFIASLVATEGAIFRFLAHDTEELKPADRLGKGLAFLAAGVGVVGGLVGMIAAYIA
ncbi:hypothetical protein C5C95_16915 [Rathayibacter sp. AY1B7]|nr:hypothetical protein C5C95_16915 [Rathayibacter sp. AY1B7]